MKRFLIAALLLAMTVSMTFTGCVKVETSRSEVLFKSMDALQKELDKTFPDETCEFALVEDYVKSWAETNDISILKASSDYMVLENGATEDCDSKKITTLQCSIDQRDSKDSLEVLATALSTLLGPESHSKIRLIITDIKDGNHSGAEAISSKYLECDNFINMQHSSNHAVYTSGATEQSFKITSKAKKTPPKFAKAYTITMSITDYSDPFNFDKKSHLPNPIEVIGSLLASVKSSGKLFEVASFTCEKKGNYTPTTATAVVVLDDNNLDSFTKKFDKSYENVSDKFDNLETSFVYTMDETELPNKVLTSESSDHLISLMYTLNTGICYQDENTGIILSSAYISNISTVGDSLVVEIKARARGSENMDNLAREYEVTSGLCSMDMTTSKAHVLWNSPGETSLASQFTKKVPLDEDESPIILKTTDNDIFADKLSHLNIITYTFSKKNQKAVLTNITNFIDPNIKTR